MERNDLLVRTSTPHSVHQDTEVVHTDNMDTFAFFLCRQSMFSNFCPVPFQLNRKKYQMSDGIARVIDSHTTLWILFFKDLTSPVGL